MCYKGGLNIDSRVYAHLIICQSFVKKKNWQKYKHNSVLTDCYKKLIKMDKFKMNWKWQYILTEITSG